MKVTSAKAKKIARIYIGSMILNNSEINADDITPDESELIVSEMLIIARKLLPKGYGSFGDLNEIIHELKHH